MAFYFYAKKRASGIGEKLYLFTFTPFFKGLGLKNPA